jgi:FkbM family methyltransferase
MLDPLRRSLRTLGAAVRLRSPAWGRRVAAAGCGTDGLAAGRGGRLRVPELGAAELSPEEAGAVLPALAALRRVARVEPVSLARTEDGRLHVVAGGLRFVVRTAGDLLVLEEIFARQLYGVAIPGPAVVWDVGMHVGAASLWLARQPFVRAVVGYELFAPTFRQALENLGLNPAWAGKVEAVNAGVGARDEERELPYAEALKGVVGLAGPLLDVPGVATRPERVSVRAAGPVLRDLRARHPGCAVVAKLDCEGAEYDIVAALRQTGQLGDVAAWMIEWHLRGPEALQAALAGAGFRCLAQRLEDPRFGMLYAFRG